MSRAADGFQKRHRREPRWIVAAPGRVNLIGEHTDYNDGYVLPVAIERYCVIAAGETGGNDATFFSVATEEEVSTPLDAAGTSATAGHWSSYVTGVIAECMARKLRPCGFTAVIESSVPYGGGLSSSASLEVATATLVEAITGTTIHPVEKALLCQRAEHRYAGVPCGIMDQFASVLGREAHLMLLDCRSQSVQQVPFRDPDITILITNTKVKHELSGSEYAKRRAECESAARKLGAISLREVSLDQLEAQGAKLTSTELRRASHVASEIARTIEAAEAVKERDWPHVGQLMYASHDSLRDDYEVSCRELDLLVELAREIGRSGGVYGARMTGGGFGGCAVSLVRSDRVEDISRKITSGYEAETGIKPAMLTSRPARGAHIVQ